MLSYQKTRITVLNHEGKGFVLTYHSPTEIVAIQELGGKQELSWMYADAEFPTILDGIMRYMNINKEDAWELLENVMPIQKLLT